METHLMCALKCPNLLRNMFVSSILKVTLKNNEFRRCQMKYVLLDILAHLSNYTVSLTTMSLITCPLWIFKRCLLQHFFLPLFLSSHSPFFFFKEWLMIFNLAYLLSSTYSSSLLVLVIGTSRVRKLRMRWRKNMVVLQSSPSNRIDETRNRKQNNRPGV